MRRTLFPNFSAQNLGERIIYKNYKMFFSDHVLHNVQNLITRRKILPIVQTIVVFLRFRVNINWNECLFMISFLMKWSCLPLVKGDPKAPFSTATTPRYRGGRYSFPWIAPLYPWYIPINAECEARRYQVPFFKSLWYDSAWNWILVSRTIGENSNH